MTDLNLLDGTTEFMRKAGQNVDGGEFFDPGASHLRWKLLDEEFAEYVDGEIDKDLVKTVDGLLDVIVVAWGSLLAYVGEEKAKAAAAEVVRSNLDKVKDGVRRREDGKILKPANWEPPKIAEAIGMDGE
ncbi:MazG-like pyrophosphatase [Mycobacterium phage Kumao]|uniref:Nucleotide pyrophosphohydrolase n=1 Tax=Mycobacterium phage Kumao TaxID=2041344 RepID=A0A2D1GQ40_9CAUD|nr:MazG-like pyrophosphatase [Mycobacterium phage Kumao]ATN94053.1 nucleotide pyrophosphohydrolase [Mycobacterium phage Kumao]